MATLETLTVDVTQEVIHDQIRKFAEALYEQSGVKLEDVRIDWYDMLIHESIIKNIKIYTTKR